MAKKLPFSSALYYPYIDIRDERWLRGAAVFWDSIRTIVPESVREPYSSEFARELNDEGILEPVRVSSEMEEVDDLAEAALDFLTDPISSALIRDISDSTGRSRRADSDQLAELTRVHGDKLPYVIRSQLRDALDDGWFQLPSGFANFYMTLLATKLASRLGIGLITEAKGADQVALNAQQRGSPISSRRPGRHYEATGPRRRLPTEVASGLLVDMIIQNIELPRTATVRQLLRFKRDHREELGVFRREINRLTSEFGEDLSLEALQQAVHDQYEAEVAPAMRALRQSLQAQSWDVGLNAFLKVSFFSTAPTALALYAGAPSSVALFAGAGVSVVASAVQLRNQRQQARASSPFSYLLSLERGR